MKKLLIVTQKIDKNDDILGFFHRWVEEFAKHYEKVTVICLYEGEHSLPANVKVLSLGKEKENTTTNPLLLRLAYTKKFYHYIWREREHYDDVFVHMNPIYIILGGVLWRAWGKTMSLWYLHKSVDSKLRLAVKLTHIIFSVSKESFRLPTEKLYVVGHGIDMGQFPKGRQKKNNQFILVTIGRISPAKDYEVLINAVGILNQKNISVHVKIVGGAGTPEQEKYVTYLRELVKEKGLERSFEFTGPVPHHDITSYLQEADLFVNMSHTGSVDKAVLEAMAAGVPTITCNEAFFTEQFIDVARFSKGDAKSLALEIEKAVSLVGRDRNAIQERLRSVVEKDHNLKSLIGKLTTYLHATKTG